MRLEQAGPMGSFIKHASGLFSPNLHQYGRTPQWPMRNLRDLSTFLSIDNALLLEQLILESQLLHQWTRMLAERIQEEHKWAHNNLGVIRDSFASASQVHAWTKTNQMAQPQPCGQMRQMAAMIPMDPPLQQSQPGTNSKDKRSITSIFVSRATTTS